MYQSCHFNNNQLTTNLTSKDFLLSLPLHFLLSHCFLHLDKDESAGICQFYHSLILDIFHVF